MDGPQTRHISQTQPSSEVPACCCCKRSRKAQDCKSQSGGLAVRGSWVRAGDAREGPTHAALAPETFPLSGACKTPDTARSPCSAKGAEERRGPLPAPITSRACCRGARASKPPPAAQNPNTELSPREQLRFPTEKGAQPGRGRWCPRGQGLTESPMQRSSGETRGQTRSSTGLCQQNPPGLQLIPRDFSCSAAPSFCIFHNAAEMPGCSPWEKGTQHNETSTAGHARGSSHHPAPPRREAAGGIAGLCTASEGSGSRAV